MKVHFTGEKGSVKICGLEEKISYFVTPGVDPTLQDLDRFKLLMTLLFPTFGNPTMPTVMEVLMFWFRQ